MSEMVKIEEQNNTEITKKDLNKMFWRLQLMQMTTNYQNMAGVAFCHMMAPVLKKIYANSSLEEKKAAMKRHLEFFVCQVNCTGLVLGLTAALEKNTTEEEKESVSATKTGLMGPLAGVGDSLVKFTLMPIFGSIGAALALDGNIFGPILMFLLYNIINVGSKYYFIHWGYSKGLSILEGDGTQKIIQRISNIANVVGLMAVGSLISSSVKLNIAAEIAVGEQVVGIQEMLNKIMPNLLPLSITMGMFFLVKKLKGKHTALVILCTFAIAVLLYACGILA
ncbi:PTS system mannose/fructose/sorbose family transporter subunit IID [Lachnospiraceae bacterium OttesenSCG-928-D06]|nr:PTS system mannose/fructose/sorbose family transporter subunit IID [Lachnospiraceae bacterium OttesenSCG-928-D06]